MSLGADVQGAGGAGRSDVYGAAVELHLVQEHEANPANDTLRVTAKAPAAQDGSIFPGLCLNEGLYEATHVKESHFSGVVKMRSALATECSSDASSSSPVSCTQRMPRPAHLVDQSRNRSLTSAFRGAT